MPKQNEEKKDLNRYKNHLQGRRILAARVRRMTIGSVPGRIGQSYPRRGLRPRLIKPDKAIANDKRPGSRIRGVCLASMTSDGTIYRTRTFNFAGIAVRRSRQVKGRSG